MTNRPVTGTQRTLRTTGWLAVCTLVWLATLALARFGPDLWGDQPALSWFALSLNVVAGIVWIIAHARFLRASDDLQRKIMLDAIAVALGAGLVGGFAYASAGHAGLVAAGSGSSAIALLSVMMSVVYLVGIAVGHLRYR